MKLSQFVLLLFCNPFLLITTVPFIPALEIETTEGNRYLKTYLNYSSLFYFYFVIFSYSQQMCVLFQLQRYPLQAGTNMLALLKIWILCLILCCNLFWFKKSVCFFQLQRSPLQKVKNIFTLFEIIVLWLFLFSNLFWLITTALFIPAPQISTTEGNKYPNTVWKYSTWFDFYFWICSC